MKSGGTDSVHASGASHCRTGGSVEQHPHRAGLRDGSCLRDNLSFAYRFTVSARARAANDDLIVRQPSFTNCAY